MQPNIEKLRHVNEWKIPAVIADWLWISVQTGERKPFERYMIPYLRPPNDINGRNGVNGNGNDGLVKNPDGSPKPSNDPLPQKESRNVNQEKVNGSVSPRPNVDNQPDAAAFQETSANSSEKPSRSPSPAKKRHGTPVPTVPLPQRPSRSDSTDPGKSAPLETAISDLLKQKRNGPQRSSSAENKDAGNRPHRRRQLLGRASSNSSTLATGNNNNSAQLHRGASRASSIDTMNEDGYGSVVEGLDSPSAKANSNAQSFTSGPATTKITATATAATTTSAAKNAGQPDAHELRENRLDFLREYNMFNDLRDREDAGLAREEPDENTPEMTQLGYEDPDAAAMREQIMQHAEKLNGESGNGGGSRDALAAAGNEKKQKNKNADSSRNLVIGRLQDHELVAGWGAGRRTRSGKDAQRR